MIGNSSTTITNEHELRVVEALVSSMMYLKAVATKEGQHFIAYALDDVIQMAQEQTDINVKVKKAEINA